MDLEFDLNEIVGELRGLVSSSRLGDELGLEKGFIAFCSAMDLVGDTELALKHAHETKSLKASIGQRYLHLYGTLQAAFVQQEAMRVIVQFVGVPEPSKKLMRPLREIRAASVGHPMGQGRNRTSHFISRMTVSGDGFLLIGDDDSNDNDITLREVDLWSLVGDHCDLVRQALEDCCENLVAREADHRKEWQIVSIEGILPNNLNYLLQKVSTAGVFGSYTLCRVHAETLLESLEAINASIKERPGLSQNRSSTVSLLDNLVHALSFIRDAAANLEEGRQVVSDEKKRVEVYTYFIEHAFSELRKCLREIDCYYSGDESSI